LLESLFFKETELLDEDAGVDREEDSVPELVELKMLKFENSESKDPSTQRCICLLLK
jgi:hypothetical protein